MRNPSTYASPHPLLFLALAPAHARGGAAVLEEFSSLGDGEFSKKFVVTLSAGGGRNHREGGTAMSSYVRVEEEREGRGERAMKILKSTFPRPGATTADTPTALTGSHAAKM